MRCLMRRIDLFCYKHPNFGIKNLMLYISIGNVLYYVLALMDTSGTFQNLLAFDAGLIFTRGEVWRLVSFVIIPLRLGITNLIWFAIEVSFYYFAGRALEAAWGKGRFTIFYFTGVLANIIYGTAMWLVGGGNVHLVAFFLHISLFFAFATLFPDTVLRVYFIIPLKAKWLAWAGTALFAYLMLVFPFPTSLLPIVAILNYLLFCGDWIFDRMRPKTIKAKQEQRKRTIDFKTAAKKYNQQQAQKSYNRKCEVCGKTDTKYPDLEFRFCSKCQGYHCFCMDHINSHVHFKE